MPYINDDGSLDDVRGEITKCDRCGVIEKTDDRTSDITCFWRWTIFRGRMMPDFGVFCYECAKKITPVIQTLRDIDELSLYVNRLKGAINVKRRNQNNRPASRNAG